MRRFRRLMMRAAQVVSDLRCPLLGPPYWSYVRLRWLWRSGGLRRRLRALRIVDGAAPAADCERAGLSSASGIAHQRGLEAEAWRCASISELRELQWLHRGAVEALIAEAREQLAEQCAIALLVDNLTEAQRRQFAAHRYFDVIGGQTGRRYRLWHRSAQNIEELDGSGKRRCIWCVHPVGVVLGDVLLAQKVALELFERDALNIARRCSEFATRVA
jgi:hypothetical protein